MNESISTRRKISGAERIGKLLLFYFIFYAVLVVFFAVMLAVFYRTLDETTPKLIGNESLIGNNPGLGFRPLPPDSEVIWYNSSDKESIQYWQDKLDEFLNAYTTTKKSKNIQNCADINRPDEGKFCDFELTEYFAPCTREYGYGFESEYGGPCIFLKLNKIFGWVPDYYNITTAPSNMPHHMKERMGFIERYRIHRLVWIDCAGEKPADNENIGPISYYPQMGFHEKYFPFKNVKGYLNPLVAVHFENPKRGVLINIECRAWARNIHHDRVNGRGSVRFKLMID